jgi:hypothetical protein
MKKITESFELDCAPERFWSVFLDENYSRALYLEQLKFRKFDVLELREGSRKLALSPALNLPGVIEKLVGDSFAYEEHGTLSGNVWTWKMVQPKDITKKPMIQTHGTIRVEPAANGKCRRTDDVTVEAKMFGIGGIIESTVEKELRSSWSKELPFLREWIKNHP